MSRSLFAALAVILLAGLSAGTARPQDKKDKKDDKKDPLLPFEPKSKPGAGQKFLEQFVGEWDVVKTFHLRAGEPTKTTGECKQTMVQDGRFLQSEFVFQTAAGKTTGTGLIGFEPDSGKFTSVWIDSRQTRMSFRQSDGKFDGTKIVLVGKVLGEGPKEGGRKSQTTTTLEDDGKKIVHRQVSIEADGTERLVMQLMMTKKTAKADAPKPAK